MGILTDFSNRAKSASLSKRLAQAARSVLVAQYDFDDFDFASQEVSVDSMMEYLNEKGFELQFDLQAFILKQMADGNMSIAHANDGMFMWIPEGIADFMVETRYATRVLEDVYNEERVEDWSEEAQQRYRQRMNDAYQEILDVIAPIVEENLGGVNPMLDVGEQGATISFSYK